MHFGLPHCQKQKWASLSGIGSLAKSFQELCTSNSLAEAALVICKSWMALTKNLSQEMYALVYRKKKQSLFVFHHIVGCAPTDVTTHGFPQPTREPYNCCTVPCIVQLHVCALKTKQKCQLLIAGSVQLRFSQFCTKFFLSM